MLEETQLQDNLDGEKSDRIVFQSRVDSQIHAIGGLQRGHSSLGGGTLVQSSRSWMSSGKCRFSATTPIDRLIAGFESFQETYYEEQPDFYRSLVGKG